MLLLISKGLLCTLGLRCIWTFSRASYLKNNTTFKEVDLFSYSVQMVKRHILSWVSWWGIFFIAGQPVLFMYLCACVYSHTHAHAQLVLSRGDNRKHGIKTVIKPIIGIKWRQWVLSELVAPSQYPNHKFLIQYLWVDFAYVVCNLSSSPPSSNYFSFIAIPTVCVAYFLLSCTSKMGISEWMLSLFVIP